MGESAYQVNKQLREMVTFAGQNLISDPPFSKLDLVSLPQCAHLPGAGDPETSHSAAALCPQRRRLPVPGTVGDVGRHIDLFEVLSKKWRIYRRIGPRRPELRRNPRSPAAHEPLRRDRPMAPLARTVRTVSRSLTQRVLLDEFAPPPVLVNRNLEILYYFGPVTRVPCVPTGEPTQDLILDPPGPAQPTPVCGSPKPSRKAPRSP